MTFVWVMTLLPKEEDRHKSRLHYWKSQKILHTQEKWHFSQLPTLSISENGKRILRYFPSYSLDLPLKINKRNLSLKLSSFEENYSVKGFLNICSLTPHTH